MKFFTLTVANCAYLMMIGVFVFMVGYHDLDSAQNWRWINCRIASYGVQPFYDTNILGVQFRNDSQYYIGVQLLLAGLVITVSGAYYFGRKLENLESGLIGKL